MNAQDLLNSTNDRPSQQSYLEYQFLSPAFGLVF